MNQQIHQPGGTRSIHFLHWKTASRGVKRKIIGRGRRGKGVGGREWGEGEKEEELGGEKRKSDWFFSQVLVKMASFSERGKTGKGNGGTRSETKRRGRAPEVERGGEDKKVSLGAGKYEKKP